MNASHATLLPLLLPPRYRVFFPTLGDSSSIHFRGSNYFHGVLSRRRNLRVIEITEIVAGPRRFTLPLTQHLFFTDTKYRYLSSIDNLFRSRNIFSYPIFSHFPIELSSFYIMYKYYSSRLSSVYSLSYTRIRAVYTPEYIYLHLSLDRLIPFDGTIMRRLTDRIVFRAICYVPITTRI